MTAQDDGATDPPAPEFPIYRMHCGEPVPDLGRMPRSRWREALRPLSHQARKSALPSTRSTAEVSRAMVVMGELELEDWQREAKLRATAAQAPTLPAPSAAPRSRVGRQVNVRLSPADFERLGRAATLLGASRTQLARGFIITGVNRLLYERRLQQTAGAD